MPWSRVDPERRNAVLLVAGIGIVVLLAVALIGYGYYVDRIEPQHATVLTVGGRQFDYSYVERRVLAERAKGRLDNTQLGQAVAQIIAGIENEELTRQAARNQGINLSDEELEARMRTKLSVASDASRESYAARLRAELLSLDLSLSEFEDIARSEALSRKMRAQFESDVPAEADHVDLRIIKLPTQAKALEAKGRLDSGEGIARVAADMSIDASKDSAGELGWVPRGSLDPKLEEWAFVNTGVSDIIETDEGFFILESRGKERRAVDNDGKNRLVSHRIDTLQAAIRKEKSTVTNLTSKQIERLATKLGVPLA